MVGIMANNTRLNKSICKIPKSCKQTQSVNMDVNDQELSKWLLNDQIKCYVRLVENEVMRSDEDVLYMWHCIIDRFYPTWDDSFKEGYSFIILIAKGVLTLANARNKKQ